MAEDTEQEARIKIEESEDVTGTDEATLLDGSHSVSQKPTTEIHQPYNPLYFALQEAVSKGQSEVVKHLIEDGADPNTPNTMEEAASKGQIEIVKILLESGADPNKYRALKKAAAKGRTDIVRLLIEMGAEPNNSPALKKAAKKGRIDVVRLLIDKGTDPNNPRALMKAASKGQTDVVRFLLEKGADPNNSEALEKATSKGHTDIVRLLQERGPDHDDLAEKELATSEDSVAMLDTLESLHKRDDNEGDDDWIIEVVKKRDIDSFNLLGMKISIPQKQIVETKDSCSASILHVVAVYGSTEMVECMKKWRGIEWDEEREISEHIFGKELTGLTVTKATALYLATFTERTEMVRSLIQHSGEDNIRCCFRNLSFSREMEEVFILDITEKLRLKHADLDPAVIPGRSCKDGSRLFIVYSKHALVHKSVSYKLEDIGLVMIRNPFFFTREVERNADMSLKVSFKDAKRAEKALSIHSETLWTNHSNLNIISVSSLIYRNKGADIIDKPCIALYCSTKGVVPLGEPEFPKKLDIGEGDYIDVDVHEGYFKWSGYNSLPSSNFHSTLKMGCNIGRSTPEMDVHGNILPFIAGSHGPFVKFNNKAGFLTCAHALFNVPVTTNLVDFQHNGTNTVEVVQPSVDSTVFGGSPCGHVHRAIFNPQLDPSIDVAVVELTDASRIPTAGQFANASHNSYRNAGFDELPEYSSGSIQADLKHFGTTHIVFQFGSSSDVTKGTLDVCGINVRPLSTELGLPRCTKKVEMKNQYQVYGAHPTMTFSTEGDSGSAVFMKSDKGDLVLIGMTIGHAYIGTNPFPLAVVTPIGAILSALGPQYSIASFP